MAKLLKSTLRPDELVYLKDPPNDVDYCGLVKGLSVVGMDF